MLSSAAAQYSNRHPDCTIRVHNQRSSPRASREEGSGNNEHSIPAAHKAGVYSAEKGNHYSYSHSGNSDAKYMYSMCLWNMNDSTHIQTNRPYSYPWYWTGTSLQLKPNWGFFSNANGINPVFMIFPLVSLHCRLVAVQYQDYKWPINSRL